MAREKRHGNVRERRRKAAGAVVLLSGGQDSTTCLFWAKRRFARVVAVSFGYGQRHVAELEAAAAIARRARVEHRVLHLDALAEIGGSALLTRAPLRDRGGAIDRACPSGLSTSFVPGRNAVFLSLAAALAVREGLRDLVTGVCETDYSGYPDCRASFVDAMARALSLAMASSAGPIRIHTPLMRLSKAQTVRLARRLPGCWKALGLSVTCYEGQRPGCGACAACRLRAAGFARAGARDPAGGG